MQRARQRETETERSGETGTGPSDKEPGRQGGIVDSIWDLIDKIIGLARKLARAIRSRL